MAPDEKNANKMQIKFLLLIFQKEKSNGRFQNVQKLLIS